MINLFKGITEKWLNFLEIKYSISDDVNKILEDMKKQIRNHRIFISEKKKKKRKKKEKKKKKKRGRKIIYL